MRYCQILPKTVHLGVIERQSTETPVDSGDLGEEHDSPAFENIETGLLEHVLATHEPAPLDETAKGEVLDLGRVEGLSAAPSTLRAVAGVRTTPG